MNRRKLLAAFLLAPFAALIKPSKAKAKAKAKAISEIESITERTIKLRFSPSITEKCRMI